MNRASRIAGDFIRALILGLAPAVFMFAGLEFASAQTWHGPVPAVYVPMRPGGSCPLLTSGHERP
jgi:hypothetical protein